ncbi:50S ribosomal protein L15 [Microgenomates group bacterium]|nr:50S ribosomal protein L15 [Microgenomates group bacterium]
MSKLNQLISTKTRSAKRVGRGYGSGIGGHTSGRGSKGQGSRKSGGVALWFEGGQLPLTKRMPMIRGKSRLKVVRPTIEVNLSALEKLTATDITLETLKLAKVVPPRTSKAKIIATGTITKAIKVTGIKATKAAQIAIEKAGGSLA